MWNVLKNLFNGAVVGLVLVFALVALLKWILK
jgi:hypothetical protein